MKLVLDQAGKAIKPQTHPNQTTFLQSNPILLQYNLIFLIFKFPISSSKFNQQIRILWVLESFPIINGAKLQVNTKHFEKNPSDSTEELPIFRENTIVSTKRGKVRWNGGKWGLISASGNRRWTVTQLELVWCLQCTVVKKWNLNNLNSFSFSDQWVICHI